LAFCLHRTCGRWAQLSESPTLRISRCNGPTVGAVQIRQFTSPLIFRQINGQSSCHFLSFRICGENRVGEKTKPTIDSVMFSHFSSDFSVVSGPGSRLPSFPRPPRRKNATKIILHASTLDLRRPISSVSLTTDKMATFRNA
jgi:hypothetical protein